VNFLTKISGKYLNNLRRIIFIGELMKFFSVGKNERASLLGWQEISPVLFHT
jgi:hypothetical protein